MRLRTIRLAGFKSFVDPTAINLPGDLIGIVGPNGCGKSNLIDAVRWVMGESSARQLRGELLADVVFNGSASRRPVGQASVELRFDNSDGRVAGRLAERGEISIRRTVNREGQSVYHLNGTRCRRRDVTDLFLGTGLGPRSYAIIEQGTVSRLIEARPEELRGFLEEAAGISLYRERRRETESRMRQTGDNLARLTDLREELEKQLAKLRRQAAQARRYTDLKGEERRLRAELLALRWRALERERRTKEAAVRAHEVRVEAARSEQRAVEAALELTRVEHGRAMDEYNARYRATLELRTEVGRAEETLARLRRQRGELTASLDRGREALAGVDSESAADETRLQELEERLAGERSRRERARAERAGAERRLRAAERELAERRTERDAFRERREAHRRRTDAAAARLAYQRTRREELSARKHRLEGERESFVEGKEDGALGCVVTELERWLEEARSRLSQQQREVSDHRRGEAHATGRLHECRERLETLSGRLAALEALQQAALIEPSDAAGDWIEANGLAAAPRLAQLLEVAPEWAFAVECVLGSRLEALRVDDVGRCAPVLESLERATVSLVSGSELAGTAPSAGGGLGDAILAGRELVEPWLAGVGTALTVDDALARRAGLAPHESIITPDGTWVGPNWVRAFRRREDDAGVLAREREIAGLRRSLARAVAGVDEHRGELDRIRAELAATEAERSALEAEWASASDRYARLRSRQAAQAAQAAAGRQRRREIGRELEEIAAELTELGAASHEGEKAVVAMREEQERLRAEGEEIDRRVQGRDMAVGADRAAAERARQAVHEAALALESTTVRVAALEEARLRSAARRAALEAEMADSERRLAGIEKPISEAEARLGEHLEDHRRVEAGLAEARESLEAKENEVKQRERERGDREAATGRERALRDELRLEWGAVRSRSDALAEQLAGAGYEAGPLAASLPCDADPEAWQGRLAEIERRLERLGPINLAAVEEVETESERKRYLDRQHADLSDALATLEEAIRRIDRDTRARFQDTFEKVGERLAEIFPRLFGGGEACLELTGDDLLDTGVTVMARPPGKRNTGIQLLSGGEKALAAIALVFAIFDLNPAPFCVLDEVDAPLDDANVDRFVDLVRELSERVQVVLVTHNKASMEAMGQLIGITMSEPGVSRPVSVDVDQALEMVTG